jgi:hypothetical protein
MLVKIPDQIVHYSRGTPFQSITSVPTEQRAEVISRFNQKNAWGLDRFMDPVYLNQRMEVEEEMRKQFIEMGGAPINRHPIYFFLGRHKGFEKQPMNIGYSIDLSSLSRDIVTFTYGDSLLSFNRDNRALSGAD